MAGSSVWLEQKSEMAILGNEGAYTTGSHIHQSVYDENNTPIDQYKWINDWQPGITHEADVGGKETLSLVWDTTVNALVNQLDRIAMQRENAYDNEGKVIGVNMAFALEGTDVTNMKKVAWKSIQYSGESEAKLRWVDIENNNREWLIGIDGGFSFTTHP
jgi:hypothetical protein